MMVFILEFKSEQLDVCTKLPKYEWLSNHRGYTEYALETWKIISNLIDERYESQIIKTRHFYVFLLKKCK